MTNLQWILAVGFLYILVLGGFSFLRREALSGQFTIEGLVLTGLGAALVYAGLPVQPILFLVVIYLVTMRIRLLVDLATMLARRGKFDWSEKLFALAENLFPDRSSRLILRINQAAMLYFSGRVELAVKMLEEALSPGNRAFLGVKYEAAGHYNLGIAYRRQGEDTRATREFKETIDSWPSSIYAHQAEIALSKGRANINNP